METLVENYVQKHQNRCSSFDQPDLQLLNNYGFLIFFYDCIFFNLGHVIYRWRGLENTFPSVYYTTPDLQKICHYAKTRSTHTTSAIKVKSGTLADLKVAQGDTVMASATF